MGTCDADHSLVILASTSASAVRVAGLPLVLRAVVSAARAGFERIVLLANDVAEAEALVANDPCARDTGVVVRERVTVETHAELTIVAGDVLVTAGALRRLASRASIRPTLVLLDGTAALARCRGEHLVARRGCRDVAASDGAVVLAALRDAGAVEASLDGEVCLRVSGRRGVARAEAALCDRVRADSAATDGVLARTIDRPLSCTLSRWIVRHTSLRPNHVTAIGTAIGLAGAVLLARGTYASGLLGTLLFLVAAIVDGCDGEVARLTFRESTFGQKLDVTTDNIVHLAIFIGLAIGVHHRTPSGHSAALAALLLGGFALDGALSYYYLVVRTDWRDVTDVPSSPRARARQRVLHALEALMNRDFAYLLVLLAIADRLDWFLWGAAIGSYVFAAVLVVMQRAGTAVDDAVPT